MTQYQEPYLVVGARGMLGTDLTDLLKAEGLQVTGVDVDEVDISVPDATASLIRKIRPSAVINVAAFTDVDGCESARERAFEVNAQGPANLASACSEFGCVLMHVSTDYVFDGTKRAPYTEDDPIKPLGVYGLSKAEGEKLVRELLPHRHCMVRTQWLYGVHGKNFVRTIMDLSGKRDLLTVVDDQWGSPTHSVDLAKAMLNLCRRGALGTYHVTNSGKTSWHGFAVRILERTGRTSVRCDPMTSAQLDRPAPRPAYSVLDNSRYVELVGEPLQSWQDALDDYLGRLA